MSEEENMYYSEKYEDAKRILQEQEPARTTPFSQKEIMSALCMKKVDFFEVQVPSYRSQRVSTSILNEINILNSFLFSTLPFYKLWILR